MSAHLYTPVHGQHMRCKRALRAIGQRLALAACAIVVGAAPVLSQAQPPSSAWKVPRTPDGRPDLQGTWTNNTATPLTRPAEFAQKRYLTPEEAKEFERTWMDRLIKTLPE